MQHDERGLPLTTASSAAAEALAACARSFIGLRTDALANLDAAITADPKFALAHALKGIFLVGIRQPRTRAAAEESLDAARNNSAGINDRERHYVSALEALLAGRITEAASRYEVITAGTPTDLIALRLCQLGLFWLGEFAWMHDIYERAASSWSPDLPGYGGYLSSRAFMLEECGHYDEAERLGREAIERDPTDCWGAHAVTHVLEMQGRHDEGVAWLDGLKDHWAHSNQIVHHLWWHRCLFEVERGEYDAALEAYDIHVRDPESPLVKAMPDYYLDLQNCASLLLRLDLRGIEIGDRWQAIADIAEGWIGNHNSPFTSPHAVMALAAAGRRGRAEEALEQIRAFADDDQGTYGPRNRAAALPAAEAMIAHREGDHERVLELLLPARRAFWQLGGSHAQRDVFTQILADSARRLGRADVLAILLDEVKSTGFDRIAERTSYAQASELVSE